MFGSFLEGSYLGSSQVGDMISSQPVPPEHLPQTVQLADDLITLPGGIMLPKKTLIVLAVAVAIAAFLWWKKRQEQEA